MHQQSTTFSPFRSFSRQEWGRLQDHPLFPVSDIDVANLKALNEPLTLDEIEAIYVPMVRMLQIYISHYRNLHNEQNEFFLKESQPIPFVIGIAGSVAAGKSTTARVLRKLLSLTPNNPRVDLVTTDGFLYPNTELQKRGIMNKKGFPESYDAKKLIAFLSALKSGQTNLKVPQYSHFYYDVISDEYITINQPDILILEGINVLQVSANRNRRSVFVSDFFDFSIYVDASEKDLRQWYLDRFLTLQKTAFTNPDSFFHQYHDFSEQELLDFANKVWDDINLPNLRENILPTRLRADLIIEKSNEHKTRSLRVRKV